MANFAPYQDISPERTRALSPSPTTSPRPERQQSKSLGTAAVTSPASPQGPEFFAPGGGWRSSSDGGYQGGRGVGGGDTEEGGTRRGFGGREDVDLFQTRLGIRMDLEACLAYLLLPPVGGVLLLVLEHRSDYVRFHAWQSSLLFTVLFIIHVIFSWSSFLSWVIFIGDLGLIGFLTWKAYVDAATLDRYEVPFFGPLASKILDDE